MDEDLGIIDEEGASIVPMVAKKIENAFFEISEDNAKLQKIMRDHKRPSNLNNLQLPVINPEI